MKRMIPALVLILCLLFTGCRGSMSVEEAFSTDDSGLLAEQESEDQVPIQGYLKLYVNGVEQETYEYFCYSTTAYYDENRVPQGFLCADGEGFFTPIQEKLPFLPIIEDYDRKEGLDVRIIDGARITQIKAYTYKTPNGGLEMDSFNSLSEFDEFFINSTGHCVIDITVLFEGPYIEELDGCENKAMDYAFIITNGISPFPTVCPGE